MEEGAEAAPSPPPAGHKREQEDEDEEALQVAKRRKVLCSEFAAITSSDAAVARRYLAGSDWHMERALNAYFDPPRGTEAAAGGAAPASADTGSCIDLTADATTSDAGVNSADSQQKEDDSNFSLITWNIDGLDPGNLKDRARGICTYLALYNPDVVFLQEVIPPHLSLLQVKAGNYTIIPGEKKPSVAKDKNQKIKFGFILSPLPKPPTILKNIKSKVKKEALNVSVIWYQHTGNIDEYFTVIMLKKSRVKLLKHEIIPFPTTAMKRNLLVVHVSVSGIELCLMTSHLESTKNHSKERIKQLQIVLNEMQKESESNTVIFGGDTNLRDSEVTKLGNLPDNIKDVWEFLDKPQHCRYTWDTQSNTNLNAAYKCKMRFDRVYFRPAVEGGHFIPRSMDLIGLEKLDCGRFPSDHWGILCNFDVIL